MKILIGLLLAASSALATPKTFEVWFISPESSKSASFVEKNPIYLALTAQANLQCQPMGDYCFDPQVGMYKPGKGEKYTVQEDYQQADKLESYDYKREGIKLEAPTSACDSDNFFDIFCAQGGKGKKREKAKIELWFDISSSMKQVDFPGYDKMCKRESFLRLMARDCGFNQEMKVMGFNEAKKQLGTMDSVCLNHGLNSRDRLIRDIKASDAPYLIVLTDIFEADERLINFIESSPGGSHKGVEKPIYADDLKAMAGDARKKCL